MAPLTILGAAVASLIDHLGLWAIAVIACGLALILGIVEAVAYAIRAHRSQVIQVPPPIVHRPVTSFKTKAAKGLDRATLNRVVQMPGGNRVR